MTSYDMIWDFAEDHHGLITSSQAVALGVDLHYLPAMAARGTLIKIGHGVYLAKHHIPKATDVYAHSVAIVGESAYLRGASVIALFDLAPTNPGIVYVGATSRVRRQLPQGLRLKDRCPCEIVDYEGIRCQPLAEALRAALDDGAMDGDRVSDAARQAVERGLLAETEVEGF